MNARRVAAVVSIERCSREIASMSTGHHRTIYYFEGGDEHSVLLLKYGVEEHDYTGTNRSESSV